MSKIRSARHYQQPSAPIRRLADTAIGPISRSLKASLKVLDRTFDQERALYLMREGRVREVADLADVKHQLETLRRPLAMLGDVWLEGGAIGARRLNGQFNARRKVVRFRKAASVEERPRTLTAFAGRLHTTANALAISVPENFLASVAVAKDQADLFNFDRFDPVTQVRIRAYQDELIRQLGVDSRVTIQETILQGLREGRTPEEILGRIRAVIGLTEKQAAAVVRFRQQLVDMDASAAKRGLLPAGVKTAIRDTLGAGTALSAERIDAMVEAYQDRYLDYRALSIATTESTRAASLGLQDSYTQAVDRGVLPKEAVRQYWQVSLDERTCDHCLSVADRNPNGVPLGEQFDSDDGPVEAPPYHVNCRCSLEFVTDLDLVPDEYDG